MDVYQWYLEPLDGFTNDVIARSLIEKIGDCDADRSVEVVDEDGARHSVWEVDYPFVAKMQQSKRSFGQPLRFNVFNKRGQGPLRPWRFGQKKKNQAPKALRMPSPAPR